MSRHFVGVDVQEGRGCCFAVLDDDGVAVSTGWLQNAAEDIVKLISQFPPGHDVFVGIDSPRHPLPTAREWYWDGNASRWKKRTNQRGYGRHCEIVVAAHRLANPQWTPIQGEAPSWMAIGFGLFHALKGRVVSTYEVFPTASYSLLSGVTDVRVLIDFSNCAAGPKDMFDAIVAAATVREFVSERGEEVGGGDGLGTIVLPRPLPTPCIAEVLVWPETNREPKDD